jgi:hypothetical protein
MVDNPQGIVVYLQKSGRLSGRLALVVGVYAPLSI